MRVTTFSEDALTPTDMPGANLPIGTTRLHGSSGGWSWRVVHFPPGFERSAPGWYRADEEVLFLEGDLEMTGEIYRAGDYAYLPAGYLRSGTRSVDGALAVAGFSASPAWSPVAPSGPMPDPVAGIHHRPWHRPIRSGPFGDGRLLREGGESQSWLIESPPPVNSPGEAIVISVGDRSLVSLDAGEPIPRIGRPFFVSLRIGSPRSDRSSDPF